MVKELAEGFWLLVKGIIEGLVVAAIVLVLGGLQNGLLWNHITPQGFNEWGVIGLAAIAFVVVVYQSVWGEPTYYGPGLNS